MDAVAGGRVAAMLQDAGVPQGLTVTELIELMRRLYPEALGLAETLHLSDLERVAAARVERLSGGQQQRLRLAVALAGNPELLVLDEPTAAFGVASRRRFWRRARLFVSDGCAALLFATHRLEEAQIVADRVLVMANGSLVTEGTIDEVRARARERSVVRCARGRDRVMKSVRRPASPTGFTIGYDLGFVGIWLRLAFGVAFPLGYTLGELFGGPHLPGWHLAVGVDFLLILGAYTAAHSLLGERVLSRVNPWVSTVIFYGPVFLVPYLDFLSITFRFALSLYIALSTLLVVFMRYGGCEVVGIPSLLSRRRYVVYCPWNAVDVVDKAIAHAPRRSRLGTWGVKVVAALTVGAAFTSLGDLRPDWLPHYLLWALYGASGIAVVALWRLAGLVGRSSREH